MANIYTDIKLFDAEYYLANNPDVATAIEGTEITAQDHYFLHGAAESLTNNDRAPNAWFNAAEYVAQNADLADVDANLLLAHFALHGVNEGRAPNAATAGEDGKIKPELLADYVNAEGNEDVKDAIAEITGAPVGAELTAEQAAIAAQHFFTYGINEDRKGGIADEISGDDTGIEAVVEALEAYQATLTAQAAADKAEQDVAAKAAAAKLVDEADEDEDYDIEDVAGKIATALNGKLDGDVRAAASTKKDDTSLLPSSLEINEQSIALVKDAQASALATAQKQVDLLKAQNAAVVTLQEKLVAYKAVATEINKTVIDTEAAFAKFDLDNGVKDTDATKLTFAVAKKEIPATGDDEAIPATPATYSAEVKVGGDTLTLTFDAKGKLVVKAEDKAEDEAGELVGASAEQIVALNAEGEGEKLVDASAEQIAALNALKGVDALKAALTAAQGNIAAQAAAEKAIKDALVTALKAEGFKAYKLEDGSLKSVSWNDAIKDGALATDVALHTAVTKDADGNVVADKDAKGYKTIASGDLYNAAPIDSNGEITSAAEATLDGTTFPIKSDPEHNGSEIGVAAAQSKGAVDAVAGIKEAMKAFDEAVAKYNEAAELQKELEAATKAVEAADEAVVEAEKAFADLDINLVKADEDGAAYGDAYNEDDAEQLADLFVFSTSLKEVDNFDGDDLFFFGDAAVALVVLDADFDVAKGKLNGDANVLEIFAVQDGANAVLYVEKEAFAGNSANAIDDNKDLVKIELVGVNAEDLQFDGGFLTLA